MSSESHSRLIMFGSAGHGGLRLAEKFVTNERLTQLFGLSEAVILDPEGTELFPDENGRFTFQYDSSADHPYMVVTEAEIENEGPIVPHTQEEVMAVIERRHRMNEARTRLISELYRPLHTHLYKFSQDFLDDKFLAAIRDGSENALRSLLKAETPTGVYSLQVFNMNFCTQLLEELENFEHSGLPINRPNSMNNYGVILDDIGFTELIDTLRERYILPLSSLLYPTHGGDTLDSHHAFMVQYRMSEDLELDFHFDDAEVTLNVCLGREFTGGDLYFRGLLSEPATHHEHAKIHHEVGRALLHVGRHRHGAMPITSGERYNLIVWFRSSKYREEHHFCSCGGGGSHHSHSHSHSEDSE